MRGPLLRFDSLMRDRTSIDLICRTSVCYQHQHWTFVTHEEVVETVVSTHSHRLRLVVVQYSQWLPCFTVSLLSAANIIPAIAVYEVFLLPSPSSDI